MSISTTRESLAIGDIYDASYKEKADAINVEILAPAPQWYTGEVDRVDTIDVTDETLMEKEDLTPWEEEDRLDVKKQHIKGKCCAPSVCIYIQVHCVVSHSFVSTLPHFRYHECQSGRLRGQG
jgi:hypothetical protein